jgi:hypothetical protein
MMHWFLTVEFSSTKFSNQNKLQRTYQPIYTKLQFIFYSLFRNCSQEMLKCIFIFVLSGIPNKDNVKMVKSQYVNNNVQMVSVTGRYVIIHQHSHQNGELTTLHYTLFVSVLGIYNLINSFQQRHQNTTQSIHKLISFNLTVFHNMQLFSNIQKCQNQHTLPACLARTLDLHVLTHTQPSSVSLPSTTTTTSNCTLKLCIKFCCLCLLRTFLVVVTTVDNAHITYNLRISDSFMDLFSLCMSSSA